MSTKLTNFVIPSAEPLTVLLQSATQSVLQGLVQRVRQLGYAEVSESHLVLFGNLDCGATHASQVAQRMQISRQAVSKTLQELQQLGFVVLEDDSGRRNRKVVVMTEYGKKLAMDARAELQSIENELGRELGIEDMAALRRALESGWGKVALAKRRSV